ncbi:MbcA/ParS/Xre antitoxin family protein [Sphingosinicella humi]|uniref:DUF2384 domain-containing protein n=1 Tax=Allosphingosinicella humi TaxID=2068657 RepID=A0A2U2J5B5_9SPHN|nr:MbcA/ParS/Xre antitoxin family protein [Sphingosinicella humi]PWG03507.1 DUF2384 domain-containing protein [Sphingosinicella humi]
MMELPSRPELLTPEQRRELTGPALRTFFRIADAWSLSEAEQAKLLGLSDAAMVRHRQGKGGEAEALEAETLERISYILGIFKRINTLLPSPERADAWMRRPNSAQVFGGRSPIERLSTGTLEDLQAVRRYLDAEVWASP